MYRYLLSLLILCYGSTAAGLSWPSLPSWPKMPSESQIRAAGRVFAEGMGDGFVGGVASRAKQPLEDLKVSVSTELAKNLPLIGTYTNKTFKQARGLVDQTATLFKSSMHTVAELSNRFVFTVAGVSAAWVIGLMVFRQWYNKEKKYTLPQVGAAQSWADIIEPMHVRDTLLQKVQFIKLVCSSRKQSGCGLYRALLLGGEHGTGKSVIAQLIARESGMRTTRISSAHFMQYSPEQCFSELYHVFAEATAHNECLIIIDNLDDFLTLHDSSFVNKLLQLFAEVMSVNKPHCMVIGITRNSAQLPNVLKNCFDDAIELTLPDYAMRKEILLHYRDLYNEKYQHILKKPLSEYFTDEELDVLAQSAEGASGAKLESMVSESVIQATMS